MAAVADLGSWVELTEVRAAEGCRLSRPILNERASLVHRVVWKTEMFRTFEAKESRDR
jgi:hypothetical protein